LTISAEKYSRKKHIGENIKITNILLILLLIVTIFSCTKKDIQFITIGTGGVTGVYYPTGGAISRMVNKNFKEYEI